MSTVAIENVTATTYGLFGIGEACIALPLTVVREVTPCPGELATLPVRAPGLLGALNLRGQVIVVLDLRVLYGDEVAQQMTPDGSTRPSCRVIVVTVHRGRLVGLVVDTVHGVTTAPVLQQLGMADELPGQQRLPVSHTFPAPADGSIVSVLDVEAVFSLPGIPMVHDGRGTHEGAFSAGETGVGELVDAADLSGSMLLVRCAQHRLAVSIDAVHTIVPRVKVRNSPLRQGSCRGVTDYNNTEIPVFDPLELAGLGRLSDQDTEGVAVRFEKGLVVMQLSEVLELIPGSAAQRLELPAVQVPGRRYLESVMRVQGRGDFLALAIDQVLRHDDLKALSRMNSRSAGRTTGGPPAQRSADWATGTSQQESEGTERAGTTYLTFALAPGEKDFAVPLEQVLEILPFPQTYSILQDGDQDALGISAHRDTVLPLFRLSALIAPQQHADLIYVLVIGTGPDRGVDGHVVGLAVHSLRAIERSIWEDPASPAAPSTRSGEQLSLAEAVAWRRTIRLAAIGTSDQPRMLSRVDLAAIGTALVPLPPPAPDPDLADLTAGSGPDDAAGQDLGVFSG